MIPGHPSSLMCSISEQVLSQILTTQNTLDLVWSHVFYVSILDWFTRFIFFHSLIFFWTEKEDEVKFRKGGIFKWSWGRKEQQQSVLYEKIFKIFWNGGCNPPEQDLRVFSASTYTQTQVHKYAHGHIHNNWRNLTVIKFNKAQWFNCSECSLSIQSPERKSYKHNCAKMI